MLTRRFFLKGMLWALGAAACSGVLAVVVPGRDLVWRLAAAAVAAAIACAVMMFFAPMVDREKSRAAGIAGMWVCVIEFMLAIAFLWAPVLTGWRWEEAWGFTILSVAVAGLPAVGFIRVMRESSAKLAGWVGLGVCAAALVLFETAIVRQALGSWSDGDEWWVTGWVIELCGGAAALCLIRTQAGFIGNVLRMLGFAGACAACGIGVFGVWYGKHDSPAWFVWPAAIGTFGVIANISFCVPLTAGQRWVRMLTIVAAGGTTALIALAATADSMGQWSEFEGALLRFASGGAIMTVSGCLALAVLAKLNKRTAFEKNDTALGEITLMCPRCGKKQTMGIGAGTCGGCKLRIQVRVQLPRCNKCDYDLTGTVGDKCPECGTDVGFGVAMAG